MMMLSDQAVRKRIHWQAHQNSNLEMPENTMTAIRYAWELGGIPELDIRQTADEVIIGIHDETPGRTTTAPASDQEKAISDLTFDQTQTWDAGLKFGEKFRGEKVPALSQVFEELVRDPERELYLDYKQVSLPKLAELIQSYRVERQIIFTHRDHVNCKTIKRLVPEVRTMLWISGSGKPEVISEIFNEALDTGFSGLDIVQIHLLYAGVPEKWPYKVQQEFLQYAFDRTAKAGIELEVFPFRFDTQTLYSLLDMGIRRYAVDTPKLFLETLRGYPRL